jgi:ABC-type transport system involved in multi-copper enzyme maturation permease subunit
MSATVASGFQVEVATSWLLRRLYRRSILAWIVAAAVLGIAVLSLWIFLEGRISDPQMRQCLNPSNLTCTPDQLATLSIFDKLNHWVSEVYLAIPLVLGIFVGAPLMGRELENRTHRLLWTQGITPLEWLTSRTLSATAFVLMVAGAVGLACVPWLLLAGSVVGPWGQFDSSLPVFESYVFFAMLLALAMGVVTARAIPAMAIAGGLWIGIRIAFAIFVRPVLLPPLVRLASLGGQQTDWFIGRAYIDAAGHQISRPQVDALLRQLGGGGPDLDATLQQHGIFIANTYQPASRFWVFQGMESIVFILLGLICLGIAIAWVRWRLAQA